MDGWIDSYTKNTHNLYMYIYIYIHICIHELYSYTHKTHTTYIYIYYIYIYTRRMEAKAKRILQWRWRASTECRTPCSSDKTCRNGPTIPCIRADHDRGHVRVGVFSVSLVIIVNIYIYIYIYICIYNVWSRFFEFDLLVTYVMSGHEMLKIIFQYMTI